jgi:hypothetical protein
MFYVLELENAKLKTAQLTATVTSSAVMKETMTTVFFILLLHIMHCSVMPALKIALCIMHILCSRTAKLKTVLLTATVTSSMVMKEMTFCIVASRFPLPASHV